MGMEGYGGKVYFVVPFDKIRPFTDVIASVMLAEIARCRDGIDCLLLRHGERYPIAEKYCKQNNFEIKRVEDNYDMVEEVMRYYGTGQYKNFVYLTNYEDRNSIDNVVSELADGGYYSELKAPNSF